MSENSELKFDLEQINKEIERMQVVTKQAATNADAATANFNQHLGALNALKTIREIYFPVPVEKLKEKPASKPASVPPK